MASYTDFNKHEVFFQARELTDPEKEKIQNYFKIKRRSEGGECGPVEKISEGTYKISFLEKEAQQRVLHKKEHVIDTIPVTLCILLTGNDTSEGKKESTENQETQSLTSPDMLEGGPDLTPPIFTSEIIEEAAALPRDRVETVETVTLEKHFESHCTTGQESVSCDYCQKSAIQSCLDCCASYCKEHVKKHLTLPKLKKHKLVAPSRDLEQDDGEEHQGEEDVCQNQIDVHIEESGKASSKGRHERLEELMKNSRPSESRARKVYTLTTKQTTLNDTVRRWTFGERDNSKKNRVILIVGQTGTGKTTLINTLGNHALGVNFDDDVWFDISEEGQSTQQTDTQTTHVTVYDVFVKKSPFSLTIIDTPGYGDTRGLLYDQLIAENLLKLFRSEDGVHTVDAIGLVLKASTNRLSTTQHYIFNAILSLFGKDIQGNIVLLITHSNGEHPENVLQAVQKGKIPCARTSEGPVYFLFDNCQRSVFKQKSKSIAESNWNLGVESIEKLYEFIDKQERKSMELTTDVLKERVQLQACVNNLIERIEFIELKQKELKQTQAAIQDNKEKIKTCKKFTYEVDVPYKVKHNIQSSISGINFAYYAELIWKYFIDRAVCCTDCEETCHYPGCWLSPYPKYCEVMRANHCTVCTNKCHFSKHVKENWKYINMTRKETRTDEDLKRRFEEQTDKSKSYVEMMRKAKEDLEKASAEKCRLVHEAYQSIMKLQEIALERDSVFTLVHLDFLIEKLHEMGDTEKVRKLEEMQKANEAKQGVVDYLRAFLKKTVSVLEKIQIRSTSPNPRSSMASQPNNRLEKK
ncbi:hypothetical protein ACEWY4_024995 [Coilia grayii]|uniref:AIG1-type G domain-containing protein n=1 Tax=Coilia grayii TaxID=363190 RepID=A0ABD1IZD5_9TELE